GPGELEPDTFSLNTLLLAEDVEADARHDGQRHDACAGEQQEPPAERSPRRSVPAFSQPHTRPRMAARAWSRGHDPATATSRNPTTGRARQRKVHLQARPISLPILDQRSTPAPLADELQGS